MATIKKLNNYEFQYTEQDLESRFDFPFILHLAKKCNVKNFDVNFAELYGVFSNESDFSGAIKRSLKKNEKIDLTNFVKKLNNIHN